MARNFVAASSQYLTNANALVTAAPLTISALVKVSSISASQTFVSIGASGSNDYFAVGIFDLGGTAAVTAVTQDSGEGGSTALTSFGSFGFGSWQHVCAVFAADDSRAAYVNGGSKGTSSTLLSPSGINTSSVGALVADALSQYVNGDMAEVAVWNAALTDTEVALLAKRVSPLMVRPGALVNYWPLIGRYSPEIDLRSGVGLTLNNAPLVADHPRIFYSPRRFIVVPSAATGGGDEVTGSGDLASGDTGIAGTGSSGSTGDGSLQSGFCSADGSGTSGSTGDGGCEAQASTADGAGDSGSTGGGSADAGSATADGSGVSGSSGSGSADAGSSLSDGTGVSGSTGSGVLESGGAAVLGSGSGIIIGNGDLFAGGSDVTGSGTSGSAGTGALNDNEPSISGVGTSGSTGSGALVSGDASVVGVIAAVTGSGELVVGLSVIDGSGTSGSTGNGALVSGLAQVHGVGIGGAFDPGDPLLALQGWIVSELGNVTEVPVFDRIPKTAPFPRITIGPGDSQPGEDDGQCATTYEVTQIIEAWSRSVGFPEADTIASLIRETIHNATPTLLGFRVIQLQWQSTDILRDNDGLTSRARLSFRALIDAA